MAHTLARFAPALLLLASLTLPPALRAEDSVLTRASIAMSKQTKRAWGLTLLCTGPIQDNPEASGYFVSKLTYNLWYETRRFIYFTRRPPKNPADLAKLFERLQLIVARVDGMLAPDGKAAFMFDCPFRDSWELVKERMAAVSQAMGGNLVDKDPPIQFPPEDGVEDETDDDPVPPEPPASPTPSAAPSPAPEPEASPAANPLDE